MLLTKIIALKLGLAKKDDAETRIHNIHEQYDYKFLGKRILEVVGSDDYGILRVLQDYNTGKFIGQEEVCHIDGWTIPKRPEYQRKAMAY